MWGGAHSQGREGRFDPFPQQIQKVASRRNSRPPAPAAHSWDGSITPKNIQIWRPTRGKSAELPERRWHSKLASHRPAFRRHWPDDLRERASVLVLLWRDKPQLSSLIQGSLGVTEVSFGKWVPNAKRHRECPLKQAAIALVREPAVCFVLFS